MTSLVHVFFSWQSDLPGAATTQVIRQGLRSAASKIESTHDVTFMLDEATTRTSGGPEIVQEIRRKVRTCDIFVGDVTTVFKAGTDARAIPNPNVLYELGYASAEVGWDRIVALFNLEFGAAGELPVDIRNHRISFFKAADPATTKQRARLTALLVEALSAVLELNPRRPRELDGLSEAELRRSRDISNLRWFLGRVPLRLIDGHIESGVDHRRLEVAAVLDLIDEVTHATSFHIYDDTMSAAVDAFHAALSASLAYDEFYRESSNSRLQIFGPRHVLPGHQSKVEAARSELLQANTDLRDSYAQLMRLIRADYVEIDLDETDRQANALLRSITDEWGDDHD